MLAMVLLTGDGDGFMGGPFINDYCLWATSGGLAVATAMHPSAPLADLHLVLSLSDSCNGSWALCFLYNMPASSCALRTGCKS